MPIIHFGKKAPKGFKELPGARHLGGGVWAIPIQKLDEAMKQIKSKAEKAKEKAK